MKKNREVKLYNVIFPVWLLFMFPLTWLLVLPANFIIDSIVLVIGMYCMKTEEKRSFYKKYILWVFLFGFLADFVGGIMLLLTQFFGSDGFVYEYITAPVAQNPFDNIYSLFYTMIAVVVSGVLIYVFNRFITFRKCDDKKTKRVIALLLTVLTTPYFFLFPTSTLYGGRTESFTNHIVWTDYIQAEVYLAEDENNDILAVESGEHFNYGLVSSFREGINTAKKTDVDLGDEWDYKVVFYKNGADSNRMDEIKIFEKGGRLYFTWKNKDYVINESEKEQIISELAEALEVNSEEVEVS